MSNAEAPQDPEHAKKVQEFLRAKELADAEKGKLDAEKNRLEAEKNRIEAQKALDAEKASAANDELKAKTAAASTAKALADAEKAQIEAQRALERARKPPDAADEARQAQTATAKAKKEVSEAQKAAAEAAKAGADATKAKAEAELAAFKARFGEVPASPYKGDVTLKENAGKTEALLLAAQAARSAAAAIAQATKKTKATEVMLIASPDVPTFDNLMRFRVELGIVQKTFDDMDRVSNAAREQEPPAPATSPPVKSARAPKRQRAVAPVAAAGLALDAADNLLGFFRTDYTVGGIDLTLEDAMLINELAGRLTENGVTVYLPKVFNGKLMQTGEDVIAELQDMALRRAQTTSTAADHEQRTALWNERAEKEADEGKKKEMTAAAEAHRRAADAIGKATALYDSWFGKLSSPDEKSSVVPIVAVIRERALMNALDNGRSLLVVKLHASGGSYYTKKNIWTVFGTMPFFHMGGTVASFALIAGTTGAVAAAGTVPVHGGFFKASRLPNQLVDEPGPPRKRSWWSTLFGGPRKSDASGAGGRASEGPKQPPPSSGTNAGVRPGTTADRGGERAEGFSAEDD